MGISPGIRRDSLARTGTEVPSARIMRERSFRELERRVKVQSKLAPSARSMLTDCPVQRSSRLMMSRSITSGSIQV
jgi:hypothetical protein